MSSSLNLHTLQYDICRLRLCPHVCHYACALSAQAEHAPYTTLCVTNVRAASNTRHNHRMPMWVTSDMDFYGAFRLFFLLWN